MGVGWQPAEQPHRACPGGSRVSALLDSLIRVNGKVVQRPDSTGASPVGRLQAGALAESSSLTLRVGVGNEFGFQRSRSASLSLAA